MAELTELRNDGMAELTEWHLEKSLISKMPKSCEDIKSAAVKTRTFTNLSTPETTSEYNLLSDILKKIARVLSISMLYYSLTYSHSHR
jgi:hypothetical protein